TEVTGLSELLLRTWERRYKVVVPYRTNAGQRLYNQKNITRLQYLKALTGNGRRIGDIAHLDDSTLQQLAMPYGKSDFGTLDIAMQSVIDVMRKKCIGSILSFDRELLESLLDSSLARFSRSVLRDHVIFPVLVEIGDKWRRSELSIAHEHFASEVISNFITTHWLSPRFTSNSQLLVVATPVNHFHSIPALFLVDEAMSQGWNALYLGTNLPASDIALACQKKNASALALSIVHSTSESSLETELVSIRKLLTPDFPILIGGSGASKMRSLLSQVNARFMFKFSELSKFFTEYCQNSGSHLGNEL
ncbi:MAG: cobalamin B12-binding domain-containing protein, partial [bacterium]|nr:cobalamin B12-binding domain-containing protein [bacterium]